MTDRLGEKGPIKESKSWELGGKAGRIARFGHTSNFKFPMRNSSELWGTGCGWSGMSRKSVGDLC